MSTSSTSVSDNISNPVAGGEGLKTAAFSPCKGLILHPYFLENFLGFAF